MNKAVYPCPETLSPGWRIKGIQGPRGPHTAGGATDVTKKVMAVPLDNHRDARSIRLHEMGHATWSPAKGPGEIATENKIDVAIIQAVEDARVGILLERSLSGIGIFDLDDMVLPLRCPNDGMTWDETMAAIDPAAFDTKLAALIGVAAERRRRTSDFADYYNALGKHFPHVPPLIDAGLKMIDDAKRGFDVMERRLTYDNFTLPVCKQMQDLIDMTAEVLKPKEAPPESDMLLDGGDEDECSEIPLPSPLKPRLIKDTTSNAPPGKMTITKAAFSRRVCGWRSGRGTSHSDTGCVMRAPHRYLIDKQIFIRKGRKPGSLLTLLVDTSGSMRLGVEDVEEIIQAAPYCTIAIYSSYGQREGELRIVARDGTYADENGLTPPGNANIIDVPALRWLGQQRGLRVWVSDGAVTGINDQTSIVVNSLCSAIIAKKRIIQVLTPEPLIDAMGTAKKTNQPVEVSLCRILSDQQRARSA